MIEIYNALKFITLLFCIQKILTFNLGVAFLKSVSIFQLSGAFHFIQAISFSLKLCPLTKTCMYAKGKPN